MRVDRELPADRRERARSELAEHAGKLSALRRLDVRCRRNHRVAGVYETSGGLIYAAMVRGHGHGGRDFVDVGHSPSGCGTRYLDFIDTGDDLTCEDSLPASCECGQRTLSRAALLAAAGNAQRRLIVD